MDLALSDKVIIVTGAGEGIGLAVVRAFAAEGARVVAGTRAGSAALDALAADGRVIPVAIDLDAPGGPDTLVRGAVRQFGGLDALVVATAAEATAARGFLDVSDDGWQRTLDHDLLGAVRACRAALPALIDRGAGAIVTVTPADGGVATAALTSLTASLAAEFGPRGIRVNAVAPGPLGDPSAGADRLARLIVLLASGRAGVVGGTAGGLLTTA